MGYRYTCSICGEVLEGDSEDGLVDAAQQHYVSDHSLQHETDVEPSGVEKDEEAIREDIEEK